MIDHELIDAFHEAAGRKCLMRGRGPCDGPMDAHHLITRNRIDWTLRELGEDVVMLATWDPRLAVCLCRRHHNRHHGFEKMPRSLLPGAAEEAIADWGLEIFADRDYA